MLHDQAEIARFLNGETRFIAAAWRGQPGKQHFVLPDGQADRFREMAKSQLRCFIPDCPRPDITVVARRPKRRDGFRHGRGAGNLHGRGNEGFHHIQGKTVIADWLRALPNGFEVELEQGVDTQRRRRARVADVMATDPATGHRLAFEIQYAPIHAADWNTRTTEYRQAGIPVSWLFGHTGANMKTRGLRSDGPTQVHLSGAASKAGLAAGTTPTMWLNPAEQQIAVLVREARGRTIPVREGDGELLLLPLADFTVRDGAMWHDAFSALLGAEKWVREEDRRERREQREREDREQREREERYRQARQRQAEEDRKREARREAERNARAASEPKPDPARDQTVWHPRMGATPPFVPAPLKPGEVRYVGPPGSPDVTTPSTLTRPGWCDLCDRPLGDEVQATGAVRHTQCARNRGVFFPGRAPRWRSQRRPPAPPPPPPGLFDL